MHSDFRYSLECIVVLPFTDNFVDDWLENNDFVPMRKKVQKLAFGFKCMMSTFHRREASRVLIISHRGGADVFPPSLPVI